MNFGNTHVKHGQGAVNAALGVMLCLVLSLFAYTSWGNRQHSLQSGLTSASTHTLNLESFLTQSLNIIELSATNFETYTLLGIDWEEVNPRLLDAVRAAPFLRSLAIADANGVIVASSALEDVGESVELGSLFPQADASIQVLRVGSPQTGRAWASRTPVATTSMAGGNAAPPQFVPVVVPISNSHTTYWLVAALNPDLFVNQATHLLGTSSSRVAWLRYDGLPLWTSDTDSAGALANHARELGHRLPDKEFGQAPQTLSDGSEVLSAYRASSRYPTAVAVYLDKQAVLAPWRGTTLEQLAVLGPALVLLLAGWTLYTRRVHQANLREAQAAEERELAARVFDSSSDAILITTPDARIVSVNAAFTHLTGFSQADVLDQNPRILSSGMHNPAFYGEMWAALQTHGRWKGHITNQRKGGGLFEANLTINAIRDASGAVHHYAGVIEDITEARRAHERLLLAGSVFDHAHEAIMITDPQGLIIEVNDAFSRITGFSREDVLGQHTRMLGSGRQGKDFYAEMWDTLARTGEWTGEIWNRRKTGEVYAEMLTISAVRGSEGEVLRYVSLFSDISQQKEHELKLERIAHFDALTGLPNRVLLSDRLLQVMATTRRRGKHLALVFLDLDGFKTVNDTFGHNVGDQLLIALALRMNQSLREGDTLARLGGDEFVAVLQDLDTHEDCMPVLERLRAAAAQPVLIDNEPIQVSASLGVTFYPQNSDIDADQLLRQADQAMYQAKLSGKNRFHVFDAVHDRNLRDHHESLEAIRTALERNELVLHYQPKVNMRTGEVLGAEALIRWQHPERGLLGPAHFLPAIENNALAIEVGQWVVHTAMQQMVNWQAQGLNLPVSVNMDAQLLQQPDVMSWLTTALARYPTLPPGNLQLEVLETSALDDMVHVSDVMRQCSAIGIGFALDDFGTGYSSLTYLKRLPAKELKIDQSFIRDMLDDAEDLAILQGVLGLATAFQRSVIAEGVETVEHGRMLLRLGCEHAQGYAIARPMPADALPQWVTTWQPDATWLTQQPIDTEDLALLFAAAEHRAWMAAFKTHLLDKQSVAPALDPHACRLGKWLQQACTAQRHAHSPLLARIIDMHNALHTQAEAMLQPPANDTSRSHTPSRLGTLSDALHAALLDLAEEPPSKALN
jgi:diguanylate cyclase (GGDEF)-like protein/PAS domain S-box-containing protein